MNSSQRDFLGVQDEGIDGRQKREENLFAGDFASGGEAQRGGLGRQLGWEDGVVDVDADAGDGAPAGELDKDAGDFAAVEHEVVGPAQIADQVGGLDDGVLRGQAQGQGEDGRGRENHGTVDAGAGFGVPGMAVASLAGGLAIGQDDGSGLEGGGGAHGGIDLGVVVDAALGEGFVEKRDVHQAETPLTRSKERGLPSLLDGAWKLLDAEARSRGAKPR